MFKTVLVFLHGLSHPCKRNFLCVSVDFLGKKLEDYVAKLPVPVFVLRARKRTGLIRARLRGRCMDSQGN